MEHHGGGTHRKGYIMIEVIYKDEKQEAKGNESIFSVPKNIRQIGQANDDYRIYMEDYVYTFLGREAGAGDVNGEDKKCLAVLTGETKWASGILDWLSAIRMNILKGRIKRISG